MKPVTFEARFALCFSLASVGCARSCRGGFLKYWSIAHFFLPLPSYLSGFTLLSSDEVKLKEDLDVWYQGLGYEEGFGLGELLSFEQKKRLIDTHTIINTSEHLERRKCFGEEGDSSAFF